MAKMFRSDLDSARRVLLVSHRKINNHVSSCTRYELEDAICSFDVVDLFMPEKPYDLSKKVYQWTNALTRSSKFADVVKPDPNPLHLDQDYDLLFAVFTSPWEILSLRSIKNWRQRCRKAVCWIEELWAKDVKGWKPLLDLLQEFDRVFLYQAGSTQAVAEITNCSCTYLPPGVDTIAFCPYPDLLNRSIDVFYLGRRSPIAHQALLNFSEQTGAFYCYDTMSSSRAIDRRDHRRLLANFTKRSRYFVVNRAKIDVPDQTGGQAEIGPRYFEGAAAGTVMIGDAPDIDAFHQNFNWQDVVIPMPFDVSNVDEIIIELDRQPDRLTEIRKNNVANSLLRHDWVYRWQSILEAVELPETAAMISRKTHLDCLAEMVQSGESIQTLQA